MGNRHAAAERLRPGGLRAATRPGRRATTTAGVLVIVGMVAGLLSVVPVLEEADYLRSLPAREGEVVSGALFQASMVPAYAGFALALYPTLRRASERLSLGFLGFRLVACALHLLAVAMLALFLDLGQGYAATGAPAYVVVAEAARLARDLVNHFAVIVATGMGDLALFAVLYRWRLLPRWLSAWGVVGIALALLASVVFLAGSVEVVSVGYLALNGPLALHGLVLAGWLVARGLDLQRLDGAGASTRVCCS
jgi:hypothetical protein